MADLAERIVRGDVILLDGAMGTELERRGVDTHGASWSGAAVETDPDTVRAIHADYVRLGCDVLITNTFGTARHVLEPVGLGDRVAPINRRAVDLAHMAIDQASDGRAVWVAGSISSMAELRTGAPRQPPSMAAAAYREQAETLAEAGVDLLILEMMRDIDYTRVIVEAAAATGLPVWVGFSCRFGADGREVLLWTDQADHPFAAGFDAAMAAGGAVAGVMHSLVPVFEPAIDIVLERWSGPVMGYPHLGGMHDGHWQFDTTYTPQDFTAAALGWVARGVQIVGGCCGFGPKYMARLRERLPARIPSAAG